MDIEETKTQILKFRDSNSYYCPSDAGIREELKKSIFKNHNLPLLNLIYNGDPAVLIYCMISKTPGFEYRKRINSDQWVWYCSLEFNHICQKWHSGKTGVSIHKNGKNPSEVLRRYHINCDPESLDQMIKCIPVNSNVHATITKDSQYNDIDLSCFTEDQWPWILRNSDNYEFVMELFGIERENLFPDYDKYMEQMYIK
jgi:hypothetical protein